MKTGLFVAAFAAVFATTAFAGDVELKSTQERISYAIGQQMGQSLRTEGIEVDLPALFLAIEDATNGTDSRLTQEDIMAALTELQSQQQAEAAKRAETNLEAGNAYLAENKKKDGVKETESGLQYKVIKSGDGNSPGAGDMVTVHYRGTLLDGTEFDSSYSRGEPATFPVTGVIQGWQEALQMMDAGSKWEVAIPSTLAYGERGAGQDIGPNATLKFEIELISFETPKHSPFGADPHGSAH